MWTNDNWEELLDNLLDDKQNHFLGSIILKHIESISGSPSRWSVVDGQQRLTTLSILLRSCFDSIQFHEKGEEIHNEARVKLRSVLFYKLKELSNEYLIKIRHSQVDENVYSSVINGEVDREKIRMSSETKKHESSSSNIEQCYEFFMRNFERNPDHAEKIWNLLLNENNKILVKIDLGSDENEQAIFDTVNTAGVRLTSADTIKNALFQKAIENTENRENVIKFYKRTWEATFANDDETIRYWAAQQSLGRLMRDRLEILLHSVALIERFYDPTSHRISDLPELYKSFIETMDNPTLYSFIHNVCRYAELFKKFFGNDDSTASYSFNQDFRRALHILDVCDVSTFHAYILKILNDYHVADETVLPVEFINEVRNIERYVLRHVVCGASLKNFNKDCSDLIAGNFTTKEMLANKLDESISDSIVQHSLKEMKTNRITNLILFWIELKRRIKDSKHEHDLKFNFSLEHVMPKKWIEHWPLSSPVVTNVETGEVIDNDILGTEVRNAAVLEIGNAILLKSTLNSSLRNFNFETKIRGDGKKLGIKHYASSLTLSSEIIDAFEEGKQWDEVSIRNRTIRLSNEFLNIW
ncbi:MAG: DUF262 domain-containing protein [Clostridiales bacterium]|nr:DUF262 domain-containing protein [Clostridiales bacterium]